MNHLIKFNELKYSTYRSASDKLKEIGHIRRSTEIDNYLINKSRKKLISEDNIGTFNLKTNKGDEFECYVDMYFKGDEFCDIFLDFYQGDIENDGLFFLFDFGVMPKDSSLLSNDFFKKLGESYFGYFSGYFYPFGFEIFINEERGNIDNFNKVYYLNKHTKINFVNRSNALKFKRELLKSIKNKGHTWKVNEKITETINYLNKEKNITDDKKITLEHFENSIRNMTLNKLYWK